MSLQEKIILFVLLVIPICFVAMHCASSTESQSNKETTNQNQAVGIDEKTKPPETESDNQPPVRSTPVPTELRIAYVPSIEGGEILDDTRDVDMAISDKLGIPVKSKIIQNYVMAVEGLGSGQFDCAMLSPLGYVLGKERYPIEPICQVMRHNSTFYKGQIIVNVDSGINSVADLKGHTFAFVDQLSTSGHLYARVLMIGEGLDLSKDIKNGPVFAGSHDKVALDVMLGTVDAGATFNDVRDRLIEKFPQIKKKTKIIAGTDLIPNENFSVRSDLDPEFKEKLKNALMDISHGVKVGMEVKQPFLKINGIYTLVSVEDSDYNSVREMISKLDFNLLSEVKKATEKQ